MIPFSEELITEKQEILEIETNRSNLIIALENEKNPQTTSEDKNELN